MKKITNTKKNTREISSNSFIPELAKYDIDSFNNLMLVNEYCEIFQIKQLCKLVDMNKYTNLCKLANAASFFIRDQPIPPNYSDLCRLHFISLSRKAINVLEFGSGYSTVVLADAMRILSRKFIENIAEVTRVGNPFHVYSVEEDHYYRSLTASRLNEELQSFATVQQSSVETLLHDNRVASIYTLLPDIVPDLIYLDGPSQFATSSNHCGLSINKSYRMPMSADILRFEFFLEPGTLIIVDGRTNNARFLRSYLRRNWIYRFDTIGDVHYFELQEEPLGTLNKMRLEFCLSGRWLIQ